MGQRTLKKSVDVFAATSQPGSQGREVAASLRVRTNGNMVRVLKGIQALGGMGNGQWGSGRMAAIPGPT